MSKIDDLTRLRHMIDASKEAVVFLTGKSKAELLRDRLLSLALVRLLEIVGEAASRVSQDKQEALPQIHCKQITGMRNRIAHAYFGIDLDVVWQTVMEDLPLLIIELEKILANESESNTDRQQYY